MMLLLLIVLKNIENPKIHKRWSAHAQYFTRCPQGFLQGFHQVSYKAFTSLHKVFVQGVYNAAQQAFTRFFAKAFISVLQSLLKTFEDIF